MFPRGVQVLVAVIVILGVGAIAVFFHQRRGFEKQARDAGVAACAESADGDRACRARLDRHHEDCFQYNFRGGGSRFEQREPGLDEEGYLACVELSPDVWLARRAALRARGARDAWP